MMWNPATFSQGSREGWPGSACWRTEFCHGVALTLALCAGFLKWQDSSVHDSDVARIESVQAAKHSTVALLSYRPDSVEKDLAAARDRLIGSFRDSYTSLTNDVAHSRS
jgi:hypothetical protein